MTRPSDGRPPFRTCIGCRSRRPQAELFRCVLDADGIARVDRVAPGRGAWLCGASCAALAVRKRAFDRAWRVKVPPEALEHVAAELTGRTN